MASLITADPEILGGKPIIRGTRISVDFILELFAAVVSREDILTDYPHLTPEAISACSAFSAIESGLADSRAGRGSTVQEVLEKYGLSL